MDKWKKMDTIEIWTKLENRMKLNEIERNWTKMKKLKNKNKLTIEIEIIGQKMKVQIRKKLGKNGRKWDNLKKL
mgnify:CR=1 FL=1